MTEALRPATAECLACGREFVPRKLGHVYCSHECRHKGPLSASERVAHDQEAVDRLFDPGRDPDERVREDDWHPTPHLSWPQLDLYDTVATRRRWYVNLGSRGR